jgi:hypothetical protein
MAKNLAADIVSFAVYRDVCTCARSVVGLVKHFRGGTWPLLFCLAMIKQEPPTWNAASRKQMYSSKTTIYGQKNCRMAWI